MPHPQVMFMLRLLASVAWADGQLAEGEKASLSRLIDASELDDSERVTAKGWLITPATLGGDEVGSLSENQRLMTYQLAVRMAHSDDELAESERSFLDRVRETLGLSAEQALEIEAEMPRRG